MGHYHIYQLSIIYTYICNYCRLANELGFFKLYKDNVKWLRIRKMMGIPHPPAPNIYVVILIVVATTTILNALLRTCLPILYLF